MYSIKAMNSKNGTQWMYYHIKYWISKIMNNSGKDKIRKNEIWNLDLRPCIVTFIFRFAGYKAVFPLIKS